MSQKTENICLDEDWLSVNYLIAECIWDPAVRKRYSAKIKSMRDELRTERRSPTYTPDASGETVDSKNAGIQMKYTGLIRNGLQPVAGKDCEFKAVNHTIPIVVSVGNFASEPIIDEL